MYEIYKRLLEERNVTTADVCKATGISQSTMSNWKKRNNALSVKNAQKVADYFGVTIEYLLYGKMYTSDDSVQTSAVAPHYDDERTEQITRKLHDNPELAVIFNAYSDLAPEDAKLISDMIMRMSDGKRKGL